MESVLRLTAKLCGDKLCVTTVGDYPVEHDGPSAIVTEDNGSILEVETPVVPLTHVQRHELYVETYLQPEEVIYPVLCEVDETYLTWELLGHPTIGIYSDLGAYWIKITAKNPSICGFESAQIRGEFAGVIKTYTPETTGGAIPVVSYSDIEDEYVYFRNTNIGSLEYTPKTDTEGNIDITWEWVGMNLGVPTFDGKTVKAGRSGSSILKCTYTGVVPASDALEIDSTFDNTNNPQIQGDPMVVPGERISLWWKIAQCEEYQEVMSDYIHTCCLTGGRVLSASRTCNAPPSYTVFIEGGIYNGLLSSDFREYEEGDWVYILKPSASGCSSCGRESGCEGSEYSGGGIIIPIHITGVSP